MINHDKKFIYSHIPKCAGSSIETALGSLCSMQRDEYIKWNSDLGHWDQHLTLQEIRDYYFAEGDQFSEYFKFSTVRNPWERMVSQMTWRHRGAFKSGSITIKTFLSRTFKIRQYHDPMRHIIPQHQFLQDDSGHPLYDFIGKVENLQEDFNQICDKIGVPRRKLRNEKRTNHRHKPYWEYYDDETLKIVTDKYARDIELFGYEFGK